MFSKSFNPDNDIPSLKGKVIIVTGANTGIGFGTVQHLARHGAKVYLGARNEKKAKAAIEVLQSEGLEPGNGEVEWLSVDFSEPHRAKAAAEDFLQKEKRLDVLVNSAALMLESEPKISSYDIQDSMMVNHISPFVFITTLLPLMKETAKDPTSDVRIVMLSSAAMSFVPKGVRFQSRDDFNQDCAGLWMGSFRRYAIVKLTNALFAKELQRKLLNEGSLIIVTYVHPGAVNTASNSKLERSEGLSATLSSFNSIARTLMLGISQYFFASILKGAYPVVFAAASPER